MYIDELQQIIKQRVPGFQIKFKNESPLMKFISKILFFKKDFMSCTTAWGNTIYLSDRKIFEANPDAYVSTFCHEFVHMLDEQENPVLYKLKYIFPQILSLLSLGAFFALLNPWFLMFLLCLLFLLPIPSTRSGIELRGYGMSIKCSLWAGNIISNERIEQIIDQFSSSAYYFMCPFRLYVRKRLDYYLISNDCLNDKNKAYQDVYNFLNK
jgi:hypothetical protein